MLATFGIMLAHRYSTDGYSDYFMSANGTNSAWKIQLGRIAGGAVEALLHLLHINPVVTQLPFTLLFLAVIAWCSADLWEMVISAFNTPDEITKGMVLASIFPAFINISFGELFFFSNCAIHWIGMLLFGQFSLRILFRGTQIREKAFSLLLLVVSLSFYQAGLAYFIIWGILIEALRGELFADKNTIKSVLEVLVIGGTASVVVVFCQKILEWSNLVAGTERSPGLFSIVNNLHYLITEGQKQVLLDGMHFMGLSLVLVIVCLTIGVVAASISDNRPIMSTWMIILLAGIAYWIAFAPHLIASSIWMAPRTILGLFSYISYCSIIILYYTSGSQHRKSSSIALAIILLAYICVSSKGVFTIGIEQIRNNTADKLQALEIVDRIRTYEQETGISIRKIGLIRDSQTTWNNTETPNVYMDINVRSGAQDWEYNGIVSYYNGVQLERVEVPQEIIDTYFAGREWDEFNPDEQVIFADETVYLAIY